MCDCKLGERARHDLRDCVVCWLDSFAVAQYGFDFEKREMNAQPHPALPQSAPFGVLHEIWGGCPLGREG